MQVVVKVHKKQDRTIVAVCDAEIVGRKFSEGEKQLDLSSDFYKGEEMDEDIAGDIIRNADIVSLAGQKSIELGKLEGIVDESLIMVVQGIPHVQAVVLRE